MTSRPATPQRRTSPALARKPIRIASILVLLVAVAGLQWPAPPVAGQTGPDLPAVQQAPAPSESNAPSADTDRWRLDRVSWSEYTCRGENPLGELLPGQSRLHVACDRMYFSIWDSYDLEGTMRMTYPMLLEGGKKAEFTLDAVGKMNWESSEGRNRQGIKSHGELYAFLYGGAGNGSCARRETVSTPSAVTGTGKAKLDNPLTCEFDPAVDFGDGDEAHVSYNLSIRVRQTLSYGGAVETKGHVTLKYKRCTNPDDCTTITGKVYVPAPQSSSSLTQGWSPTRPSTGRLPLIDVPVTLTRNGVLLGQTVTLAPDGRFLLIGVPNTDSLTLGVNLMHGHHDQPIYRVRYGGLGGPIARVLSTLPTVSASITRDIEFSDNRDVTTYDAINRDHLDDLGVIYYHTHQAWELADRLGQVLDFPQALDIIAFSNKESVFWDGPGTGTGEIVPHQRINIAAAEGQSEITDGCRPDNREWHEFGHHVMADAFGNLMPSDRDPRVDNHGGYWNPSTTDSWMEGFAEFYSMMVASEIDGDRAAHEYKIGGTVLQLEPNFLAWNTTNTARADSDEELAVAGLLWDLVDPVDKTDTTELGGTTYADCVEVSFANRLWDILTTDWGDAVPRSDAAPPGYGYIFDVKHLYDVLKMQGIGDSHSCGPGLTDLDELFIAHGFFADMDTDQIYDPGEEIGRAAYQGEPNRRKQPPPVGSYLAFQAVDDQTGAPVPVQDFSVEVRFPPPHEHFSYSFRTNTAQTPGHLLFLAPDAQFQTTTYVTAAAPGYVGKEPLAVTNAFYYEQMASGPSDHFMEHTFDMERYEGGCYLPLVAR